MHIVVFPVSYAVWQDRQLSFEGVQQWTQEAVGTSLGVARQTVASWFTTNASDGNGSKTPTPVAARDAGKLSSSTRTIWIEWFIFQQATPQQVALTLHKLLESTK